ncbi:MAG: hypothetical protein AB1571_03760 [Nanoarchaeota archaeon]
MEKRGQVTLFIILGIVILTVIVLVFFLRDTIVEKALGPSGTKRIISNEADNIKDEIVKCIDEKARPALEILGKQGGSFNPQKYRLYNGNKVNYLCYNIPNDNKCLNQMLLKSKLEAELNTYLSREIFSCIDISSFAGTTEITTGEFKINSEIGDDGVLVNVDYPITIKKKEITQSISEFSKQVDIPLGKIVVAVNDILNDEASGRGFDIVGYVKAKKSLYDISVRQPSPDKVYIVNVYGDEYKLQFAIEGGA